MELSGNVELAEKLAKIFKNVNLKEVCVIGRFVHISTFKKYSKYIEESLFQSGYKILKVGHNYKGDYQISAMPN